MHDLMRVARHCLVLGLAAGALAQTRGQDPAGWTLEWADEFDQADGSPPDPAKWDLQTGAGGWGNNELQYYTSRTENARVEGGQLIIEARSEEHEGSDFTSARLRTKGKASWTFGRIEARMKIPRGLGIWPAFWMLGDAIEELGWPEGGEIDIMENIGSRPSVLHGTVHGPGYSGGNGISGSLTLAEGDLGDDFHVYGIEWDENRIRWMLDGQPFFTVTPDELPAGTDWVFNRPYHLLLNIAVGGNWPGPPDGGTVFPQRLMVDYVRVFRGTGTTPRTVVTVDPGASWKGYMNVSELPGNGGGYIFGGSWDPADLRAGFDGPVVTLAPNTIDDPSSFWYVGGGSPGNPGNKTMDANFYVEETDGLSGRRITFEGDVLESTLTGAHAGVAFIKDFAADFSSYRSATVPLLEGRFSVSLETLPGPGRHVQYGFRLLGPNVWSTDVAPFGSVRVTAVPPDSFGDWIGSFDFATMADPDLTAGGDPDGDGLDNLTEFALDGDPGSGVASGKVRSWVEVTPGGAFLRITLPVRGDPSFSGDLAKSATVGALVYRVEGSNDLETFDREVLEIAPSADGMPALRDGWTYRAFRLAGDLEGSTPRGPKGYLRVRVSRVP